MAEAEKTAQRGDSTRSKCLVLLNGVGTSDERDVRLTLDELETIRLIDFEGLDQRQTCGNVHGRQGNGGGSVRGRGTPLRTRW